MVEELIKETLAFAARYRLLLLTFGLMIAIGVCWDIFAVRRKPPATHAVKKVRFLRGMGWVLGSILAILLSASTFLYISTDEVSAYPERLSFTDWDDFRDSVKVSLYVSQSHTTSQPDSAFLYRSQRMLDRSSSRFDSALAQIGLQQYSNAISTLDRELEKVRSQPSRSNYARKLFYFRAVAGSYSNQNEDALASYDSALARSDTYAEAWFSRALVLRKLGRFDESQQSFNRAIANADSKNMFVMLGMAYFEYGALDKSLASFNKALSLDTNYAEAFSGRALVRHRIGNIQGSLNDLETSLAVDSTNAKSWSQKGIVLAALGRLELVLTSLDKARSLIGRDSCVVLVNNANALINLEEEDKIEEAMELLYSAIDGYPYSAAAFYQLSRALLKLGQLEKSRVNADIATELAPQYSDAFLLAGVLGAKMGDTTGAMFSLDSAFEINSQTDEALAWLNRGCAFLESEWPDSALISINRAFAMGESSPALGYKIAKGLIAVDQPRFALISVRRTLRQDSSFVEALELEAELAQLIE